MLILAFSDDCMQLLRFLYEQLTWNYIFWPDGLYISSGRVRCKKDFMMKMLCVIKYQKAQGIRGNCKNTDIWHSKYYSWIRASKEAYTITYKKLNQSYGIFLSAVVAERISKAHLAKICHWSHPTSGAPPFLYALQWFKCHRLNTIYLGNPFLSLSCSFQFISASWLQALTLSSSLVPSRRALPVPCDVKNVL